MSYYGGFILWDIVSYIFGLFNVKFLLGKVVINYNIKIVEKYDLFIVFRGFCIYIVDVFMY